MSINEKKLGDIVPDITALEEEFGYDWYDHEEDIPADNPHYMRIRVLRESKDTDEGPGGTSRNSRTMTEEEKKAELAEMKRLIFKEHIALIKVGNMLGYNYGQAAVDYRIQLYGLQEEWEAERFNRRRIIIIDTLEGTEKIYPTKKAAAKELHANAYIIGKMLNGILFKSRYLAQMYVDRQAQEEKENGVSENQTDSEEPA